MIPRIDLPEEVRRFYRGNIEFIEYDDGTVMPILQGGAFDEDESEDDEDDADTSESDDEDDDGESDEDKKKPEADPKDLRIRDLSRESGRYRRRLREEKEAHAATKEELSKVKKNGVSDEKLRKANEELQAKVDALTEANNTLRITQEIHKHVSELNLDPKRVRAIVRVIDLDDVDVDDDGVSGVREALEQVAQDFPEWVVKPSGNDDKDDDGGSRPSGQSSRKPRKKAEGIDRQTLLMNYPALQQS